jgi:cell division protease FtsH
MSEQETEPKLHRDRQPSERPPSRPWRTEGLPQGQPPKRRSRWLTMAVLLIGYLILFEVLTMQDQMSGPQAVSYTEFKAQVMKKTVAQIFARGSTIKESLREPARCQVSWAALISSSPPSGPPSLPTTCLPS